MRLMKAYDVYNSQGGDYSGSIVFTGRTEEEIAEKLQIYLETHQDVSAVEAE